jgi:hypothetical protein
MRLKKIQRMIFVLILFLVAVNSVSCNLNHQNGSEDESTTDPSCIANKLVILYEFLVRNEDLPSGWHLGEKGIGIQYERSRDSAGSYYSTDDYQDEFPRLLDQMIYRHEKLEEAESDYINATDGVWDPNPPSGWNFQSTFADESGIFCSDDQGRYYCLWVARYGCIVIDMVGGATPGYPTFDFEVMENIIRLVDDKAGELLKLEEE